MIRNSILLSILGSPQIWVGGKGLEFHSYLLRRLMSGTLRCCQFSDCSRSLGVHICTEGKKKVTSLFHRQRIRIAWTITLHYINYFKYWPQYIRSQSVPSEWSSPEIVITFLNWTIVIWRTFPNIFLFTKTHI